jgi:RimJ/RimL family protein N-acetyltransferase
MGVDLKKVPTREEWVRMLSEHISLPIEQKRSYYVIWQVNGQAVGHSNINKIKMGEEASMHLHVWFADKRTKGNGTAFVKMSLPYYFEKFKVKKLYSEPYILNPSPNKTLEKVGFTFIKKYTTIPGGISVEQEVNRWELTYEDFKKLN